MTFPRYVTIGPHRARYFVSGHGRVPIVLVPSMYLLARTYAVTARAIVAADPGYRVITIELPGSGGSGAIGSRWSFDEYAQFLMSALKRLGIERPAAMIGHSVSAGVILTAAARYPSSIGPIVLADSIGGDVNARLRWIIPGRFYDFLYEPQFGIRSAADAVFNACHHPRSVLNLFALAQQDLSSIARGVHGPALLAWGAFDHTTPLRCARAMGDAMANASTYVSRAGSHDWIVERPEEFAAALRSFLRPTGILPAG